jgi:regulator of sigma E protease
MTTFITFVIVFGLIIFVHELGHFLAAKFLGVGVKTFAFGFPPRLWSKKIGETEYAVNLIPFGGYVKLEGETEETEEIDTIILEEKRSGKERGAKKNSQKSGKLYDQKPSGLLLIFSAGVLMNILAATVIIWFCFIVGFKPIELGEYSQKVYPGIDGSAGVISTLEVKIDEVEKNTPAEKEGVKSGDIVLEVDGKKVYFGGEVVKIIQSKATDKGARVQLKIKRGNQKLDKTLSTYKSKIKDSKGKELEVNRVGLVLETTGKLKAGPFSAISASVTSSWHLTKYTIIGIVDFFGKILTQLKLSDKVVGPIGLVVVTNYFAHLGLGAIVQFAAILSLSVALFNILPIPALDGGYIAFTLVEVSSKRKISLKTKNIINLIGFSALIVLMLFVTFRDFFAFDVWDFILKLTGR